MNFFSAFCFLDDLLKVHFLPDASVFTIIDDEKEKIDQKYFFMIWTFQEKFWKFINTVDSQ